MCHNKCDKCVGCNTAMIKTEKNMLYKKMKNTLLAVVLTAMTTSIASAADDGPRMYWNAPVDLNIMQTYSLKVNGNAVVPSGALYDRDVSVNMDLVLMGYNRIFDFMGNSAIFTTIVTAGSASATIPTSPTTTISQSTRGYGDVYFQGTFNLIGGPALSAEEFATYKQDTLLSLLLGLSTPTGEYDSDRILNMGANRWALRVGLPFVKTLSKEWLPGKITTLEILPSVWIYGDNDEYVNQQKLEQDELYTLEMHLTHDLSPTFFVSLDYLYQTGGETTVNGVKSDDAQSADFIGATFAYMVNEQLQFQFRYSATLNPDPEKELSVDNMQLNLNYFW